MVIVVLIVIVLVEVIVRIGCGSCSTWSGISRGIIPTIACLRSSIITMLLWVVIPWVVLRVLTVTWICWVLWGCRYNWLMRPDLRKDCRDT